MSDGRIFSSKAAEKNCGGAVRKPELLCPAGSPAAFDAAIEAGADAIYIGGTAFNARINAKNFTAEDIRSAVKRAHSFGVKVYIAANTLIYDRERDDYIRAAREAYLCGADAMIVADIGAASLIKKYIPDIELHASTQLSGHNLAAAERLSEAGFSRMVLAREMPRDDIKLFTENSPIEAEVFVHGALCVCHSGQCLFSSLVGGRSGNRGECAQPCRLPYKNMGKNDYPLSLKDLCLAGHIKELCDMGVASFKIEGRMKSPEYVRDVARIWRRLIDEGRDANDDEMDELAHIFSRGGFTDGYYRKDISRKMMGVRSNDNKRDTRELVAFDGLKRKISLELKATVKKDEPIALTAYPAGITVFGDIPETAINLAIDEETVKRCLSKLGGTLFEAREIEIELDDGLMVPISKLNALRRACVDKLLEVGEKKRRIADFESVSTEKSERFRSNSKTAVFYNAKSVTEKSKRFFDVIYLPLEDYDGSVEGVLLPSVIFDSEAEKVTDMLRAAKEKGALHALVGNIGHIDLVLEAGLIPHGDFRLNVSNRDSMRELEKSGFEDIVLSPELTLPRMRDIGGRSSAIVYGRIPLMVTEKCLGKELASCDTCRAGKVKLVDRKNVSFPIFREWQHRSIIFNSVPFFMADKQDELCRYGISMRHFIFSDETPSEVDRVILCYEKGLPLERAFRRMN